MDLRENIIDDGISSRVLDSTSNLVYNKISDNNYRNSISEIPNYLENDESYTSSHGPKQGLEHIEENSMNNFDNKTRTDNTSHELYGSQMLKQSLNHDVPIQYNRFRSASRAFTLLKRVASNMSIVKKPNQSTLDQTEMLDNPNQLRRSESYLSRMTSRDSELSDLEGYWNQTELPMFMVPKLTELSLPLSCRIISVDGSVLQEIFIHHWETGQYLMDNLVRSFDITDTRFLGIKLIETCSENDDLRSPWVELSESVFNQVKRRAKELRRISTDRGIRTPQQPRKFATRSLDFLLRFRYYPPHPNYLSDNFTRDYLWLQLRRDLRLSKLVSSTSNMKKLMAMILQYELGDYSAQHLSLVDKMFLYPGQKILQTGAIEFWRTKLQRMSRKQVQYHFLRACMMLEIYGFDLYSVKHHQTNGPLLLGFNFVGIKAIEDNRIVECVKWHNVHKVCSEGKIIIIHHLNPKNFSKKLCLGFKCQSRTECHSLLHRILDHKYFFTVDLVHFERGPVFDIGIQSRPDSESTSHNPTDTFSEDDICNTTEQTIIGPQNSLDEIYLGNNSLDQSEKKQFYCKQSVDNPHMSQNLDSKNISDGGLDNLEDIVDNQNEKNDNIEISYKNLSSNDNLTATVSDNDIQSYGQDLSSHGTGCTDETNHYIKWLYQDQRSTSDNIEVIFDRATKGLDTPRDKANSTELALPILRTCLIVLLACFIWRMLDVITNFVVEYLN